MGTSSQGYTRMGRQIDVELMTIKIRENSRKIV